MVFSTCEFLPYQYIEPRTPVNSQAILTGHVYSVMLAAKYTAQIVCTWSFLVRLLMLDVHQPELCASRK